MIGASKNVESIRTYLECDSLGYLSLEGMLSMHSLPETSFCTACFSGHYPTELEPREGGKHIFEVGEAAESA